MICCVAQPAVNHMRVIMQAALNRGLLPDDNTLTQLAQEQDSPVYGHSVDSLRWPDPELRVVLIRKHFCHSSHTLQQQPHLFLHWAEHAASQMWRDLVHSSRILFDALHESHLAKGRIEQLLVVWYTYSCPVLLRWHSIPLWCTEHCCHKQSFNTLRNLYARLRLARGPVLSCNATSLQPRKVLWQPCSYA